MRQIAIVVEGQTERYFVEHVLQAHLGQDIWLTPIVVHTNRSASGVTRRGGGGWKHYIHMLRSLSRESHWHMITTLVDLYGFPKDGPDCRCDPTHRAIPCAADRARRVRSEFDDARIRPFIAVHELETLVLAAAARSSSVFGDRDAANRIRRLVLDDHDGNAEAINGGVHTAPSKRIANVIPNYEKTRDGIALLQDVELSEVLALAPHAASWVDSLTRE